MKTMKKDDQKIIQWRKEYEKKENGRNQYRNISEDNKITF